MEFSSRPACFPDRSAGRTGFGPSGQIGSEQGSAPASDSFTVSGSRAAVYLGPNGGLVAGQILRVRQLVGWTLADRPSSAGIQAQARLAT